MSRVPIRLNSPSKSIRPREREADILKTILEGLNALRVWHCRMNSGAMFAEHGGKKRMLRFGRRGMADILVMHRTAYNVLGARLVIIIWIEVKRPGEKQTPDQLAFQAEVEAEGHRYLVARSWDDVVAALK